MILAERLNGLKLFTRFILYCLVFFNAKKHLFFQSIENIFLLLVAIILYFFISKSIKIKNCRMIWRKRGRKAFILKSVYLPYMYDKIKENVSDELILLEKELKDLLQSEVYLLDEILNHINGNRGKRLRPVVMFLVSNLFGKEETLQRKLIDYAVAIEALHQATLVHDDVVDDSKERRGKPSVNSIWNNKASVLVGDYMFAKAFDVIYRYKNFEVLKIASNTMKVMTEGELLALKFINTLSQTEEDYYRIIYSKTASLIETSCRIAGMTYTDNLELIDSLAEFWKNIGMGFQMRDDLFDYTDDNKLIGKPVGNDIKEHQITLPLIYALNNSSAMEREPILSILKLSTISDVKISDAQIKDVISFTKAMGGLTYTENKAKNFVNKAIKCLEIFPDGNAKDKLIDFARYMVEREK